MAGISSPLAFRLEARYQRVCAVCGRGGDPWHAHHVVSHQLLVRLGLPPDDTRNALRLCDRCHMDFEWGGPGKVAITVFHLTDQNICFVWETLGPTVSMIERKYHGSFGLDPRWQAHRMGECELCQLSPQPEPIPTRP